jgi:hypothetical protein
MKRKKKLKPAPNMIHVLCAYKHLKDWERVLDAVVVKTSTAAYEVLNQVNIASDPKFRKLPIVEALRTQVLALTDSLVSVSGR